MKTRITLATAVALLFSVSTAFAQNVGIGTSTPAASAKLHIVDANRGLLIPNVSLVNVTNGVTPVATPAMGLLVWNTNAAVTGGSGTGYYYWDGAAWVRLLSSQTNDWALLGNAGTNPATNFVGTTDNQSLVFRTNNVERYRITTSGQLQANQNGAAAAPVYTWLNDNNTGIFHSALVDDIGISTGGVQRFWISDAGEVYVGGTAPTLPGDLFNVTATNTNAVTSGSGVLSWAMNGYTAFNGGAVYGMRLATSTGAWGTGQFEMAAGFNVATARGVYGIANATSQYGVNGFKPAGGLGWGGLFQNDLGYTGFFGAASDRRLKKNINNLTGALSIITQLPIYTYQYKTEDYDVLGDDGLHYGVMADELKLLAPDLVKEKTLAGGSIRSIGDGRQPRGVEGTVELVNYIELVPIAIQAIKEQQLLIEEQAEQIQLLREEIEALKK